MATETDGAGAVFKQLLEELYKFSSDPRFEKKAKEAYDEFEGRAGTVYEDDESYENRMTAFLEWFILEKPAADGGKRVIDVYRNERARGSETELQLLAALDECVHDIFHVRSVKKPYVKVDSLVSNKTCWIEDEERAQTLRKGDLFEGRIIQFGKTWLMTNTLLNHPSKVFKFVKAEGKAIRKNGGDGLKDFIFRLTTMRTRWERSRRIDAAEIYK